MRFVVTGEWTRNRLLKAVVACFLAYTAILWLTSLALYFSKMSLTPASVVDYYLGNPQKFTQPRSILGLLEVLHFHSFAIGILLLTLTHLLLFVPVSVRVKAWGIVLSFSAGLSNELSGWLVRFVHPGFAWAKIFSFLLLEGTILWIMVLVTHSLLDRSPPDVDEGGALP
ncbi:MAG: hypothetical protein ACE5D3_00155 [Candidatus Binatia bacterium]